MTKLVRRKKTAAEREAEEEEEIREYGMEVTRDEALSDGVKIC